MSSYTVLVGKRSSAIKCARQQDVYVRKKHRYLRAQDETALAFRNNASGKSIVVRIFAFSYLRTTKSRFCLLDEIQQLAEFESGLRYLQNQNATIVITGSNSALSEKSVATSLRDVVERHEIKNVDLVEKLFHKALLSFATLKAAFF
ncbi:MAG: AAA family ATPase [Spirochaeta sp.]|nr:AAA family ATPase [Spirochaeta sp.]